MTGNLALVNTMTASNATGKTKEVVALKTSKSLIFMA
jgi:hypothetical protein